MAIQLKRIDEIVSDNGITIYDNSKEKTIEDICNFLDCSVNEIYDNIFTICYSKTNIFSKSEMTITPIDLINTFLDELKKKYEKDFNWDILNPNYSESVSDSLLFCRKFLLNAQYSEIENQSFKFKVMLESLQSNIISDMESKARVAKAQFQSTVTGLQFGLLTSSATTFTLYAIEEIRTIAQQQRKADKAYNDYISTLQSQVAMDLLNSYNEYIETIFKPYYQNALKNLFENYKTIIISNLV